jgi:hypothetical protein
MRAKSKTADQAVQTLARKTQTNAHAITEQEARNALRRSGYLLEHRTEAILRRSGWYVEANSAYEDSETHKSRELDLYALTSSPIDAAFQEDRLYTSVLIECVNSPQPIAFITKNPIMRRWAVSDVKATFDPEHIIDATTEARTDVVDLIELAKYHHYCAGRIATQFCSFKRKSDKEKEWMAWHDESHFGVFHSLVKALEYKLGQFQIKSGTYINWEFLHPVVVVQGSLLDVRCAGGSVEIRKTSHVKYRRTVIWKGEERGYMIDVVTERSFPRYITMLEAELKRTAFRVRRHAQLIKDSLRTKYENLGMAQTPLNSTNLSTVNSVNN